MKLLIAIPSKGRPYKIGSQTLKWLTKCDLPDWVEWKVFVEPQEKVYYKQTVGKENIIVLPEKDQGIGYSKCIANEYAVVNGFGLIMYMDDDVSGFIDSRKKMEHASEVFVNLLEDIIPDFTTYPDLGLVRFISSKKFYFEGSSTKKYLYKNPGGWGCQILRVDINKMHPSYTHYEDTALQLWVMNQGYYSLMYGKAGIAVKVYTNPGGFQTRDRRKDAEDAVAAIDKHFPGVFLEDAGNTLGYDINVSKYMDGKTEKL